MAQVKQFTPAILGVKGTRAKVMLGEATLVGELPAIVVTVRMTAKGISGFVHCCQMYGIHIRECRPGAVAYVPDRDAIRQGARDGIRQWEAIGECEALEALAGHPSVVEWDYLYTTANAIEVRGSGNTKK